jgi:hypothetical protein
LLIGVAGCDHSAQALADRTKARFIDLLSPAGVLGKPPRLLVCHK